MDFIQEQTERVERTLTVSHGIVVQDLNVLQKISIRIAVSEVRRKIEMLIAAASKTPKSTMACVVIEQLLHETLALCAAKLPPEQLKEVALVFANLLESYTQTARHAVEYELLH